MADSSFEPDPGSAQTGAQKTDCAQDSPDSSLSRAFVGGNLGPTDNTATIISRALPNPSRGDMCMAEILRGRKLAHFELLEAIGVGGMAAVIKARDTQLDRTVALKVLPPDMACDPENVLRFQQEARAAAKLDHENIARVFYCGEDQGLHFIAFELVEGENLRLRLEKQGRLPVPEALSYVLQIATGLAHAAARAVVHRDIKPSNIIISANGRAKLVDMGLARSLETHQDDGLTQSGVTLGTFDYISPEQALEPRQADARSDIYSLGCTFYQMVTGQAPVPEGTAAKKLHHHQHVAPVDPRQLNPAISTNVALVLAKMIAKNPNNRYQHPEELVEHLIALARLEGGRDEKPDGVLFVDARLPGPNVGKPILTTCAAVAALCVLVVVLGQSPSDNPSSATPFKSGISKDASTGSETGDAPELALRQPEEAPGQPGSTASEPRIYRAVSGGHDLAQVLKTGSPARVLIPAAGINLNREDQLEFDGKELIIEAETSLQEKKPLIRLSYDARPPGIPPWAIITVRGGSVRIRGIRFELDSAGADIEMNAVSRQGGSVVFDDCEFVQVRGTEHGRITSVQVAGLPPTTETPALLFNRCFFESGQQAVVLNSPNSAKFTQCAFGPHTGFLIEVGDVGGRSTGDFDITLTHCSALASSDSIFHCRDGVSGAFSVDKSIFARVDITGGSNRSTALLRQDGAASARLRYSGVATVYYNLAPFYVRMQDGTAQENALGLEAFDKRVGVLDDQSQELTRSPWQDVDPAKALENGYSSRAFRVNPTIAVLRQPKALRKPVGVERCSWGEVYGEPLPPLEPSHIAETPFRRDEKVVDPALVGIQEGVYRTLRQAVEDARPEDVILIKHNGPLLVDSVRLEKPEMDITIRPFKGYKPLLKLGKTTDSEAALFRLFDSHLRLEGLEIHLAPTNSQFKTQTVVAIMGDGQLTMKDCVVTLEEIRETPLYMVMLADPAGSGVIRMDPQPAGQQQPRIHLDNCFVRGAGDLVYVLASRPFSLQVENCLVALDGSFLIVDGAGKDPGMRTRSDIVLKQVTAYLTNHLFWLRASREEGRATKGLTPTYVQSATDCVFASATGKTLVHLDGFDADEQMKRSFVWGESKRNLYANYDQLLDQVPFMEGDMMPPTPYGRQEWGDFTKEPEPRFDRLRFAGVPLHDSSLAKATAADFRMKAEANLQASGAELDRLPLSAEESAHHEGR